MLFGKEVTTPAVLPAVSYRGVRPWQRGGAEPSAQRTLTPRGGSQGASRNCDCQHQGGWGPAARGTVNPGEPPQASSHRTSQRCCQAWTKRYVARSGRSELARRRCRATGVEAGPNPRRFRRCNVVSPLSPPPRTPRGRGKRAARRAGGAAGRGGGRKRMPCCNGADRGCAGRPHHPTRKRADFPLVLAYVNRQPTGVGSDADMSAGSQRSLLVLLPPSEPFR